MEQELQGVISKSCQTNAKKKNSHSVTVTGWMPSNPLWSIKAITGVSVVAEQWVPPCVKKMAHFNGEEK